MSTKVLQRLRKPAHDMTTSDCSCEPAHMRSFAIAFAFLMLYMQNRIRRMFRQTEYMLHYCSQSFICVVGLHSLPLKGVDRNTSEDTNHTCTCTMFIINLYHSLGIFSRRQTDDILLIFPRKQDLIFQANCLLRRQFA